MNENQPKSGLQLTSGGSRVLLLVVCSIVLALFAYCLFVSVMGIANESIFFNFVELLPLGLMVVVFWLSQLFKPKSRQ